MKTACSDALCFKVNVPATEGLAPDVHVLYVKNYGVRREVCIAECDINTPLYWRKDTVQKFRLYFLDRNVV